jgi:hypothetical protein
MRKEIINNLENPKILEKLYRDNKTTFKKSFDLVYPEIQDNTTAQIWNERLNFEQKEISWGTKYELLIVIVLSFIAGLIAKIPDFTGQDPEYYYPRHLSFIIFPMLSTYFVWKQSMQKNKLLLISIVFLLSVFYINFLPNNDKSDTLFLACIHLPLFLWSILGFTYTGNEFKNLHKRIDFLRYNGDLVVITTVILIAGGILSAVTVGLFELINIKIGEFYFQNVAIWGLAAAPIIGTYLVQTNPQLVKNVSPIIAKVFTPLVLVMLIVYLIAIIYTGKDPYNDREFLLIFNVLLIGVMAIILFSVAETSNNTGNKISTMLLFLLSLVTIIINGIALSAIIFRISEWGITPNRLAVLGGNALILINLMMVTYKLFKSQRNPDELMNVENSIAAFLPVYSVWTIVVTFLFPLIFNFI